MKPGSPKQSKRVTFAILDPNPQDITVKLLRQILIEKLIAKLATEEWSSSPV